MLVNFPIFKVTAFSDVPCSNRYNSTSYSVCSSLTTCSMVIENSSCDPVPYAGSVCSAQLLARQRCAALGDMSSGITIEANVSQNQIKLEQNLAQVLQTLGQ